MRSNERFLVGTLIIPAVNQKNNKNSNKLLLYLSNFYPNSIRLYSFC